MSKILIIEDEEAIADLEKDYLELSGFEVEIEHRGDVGLKKALEGNYDLFILDLMLPEVDGFEICREIRNVKNNPVIMVSAKKDDIDKIRGLGLGADDYITKPFSTMVLRARIRALLRRTAPEQETDYAQGPFRFQFATMEFLKNGIPVDLSRTEQRILYLLVFHPGQILTRERLMEWVWPDGTEYVEDNALSVGIRRLRDKLEDNPSKPEHIKTVYGKGYQWENSL